MGTSHGSGNPWLGVGEIKEEEVNGNGGCVGLRRKVVFLFFDGDKAEEMCVGCACQPLQREQTQTSETG